MKNPMSAGPATMSRPGARRKTASPVRIRRPAATNGARRPSSRGASQATITDAGSCPAFSAVRHGPISSGRPVARRNSGMNAFAPKYAADAPPSVNPSRSVGVPRQSGHHRRGAAPGAGGGAGSARSQSAVSSTGTDQTTKLHSQLPPTSGSTSGQGERGADRLADEQPVAVHGRREPDARGIPLARRARASRAG